jgi:hypothetical protein
MMVNLLYIFDSRGEIVEDNLNLPDTDYEIIHLTHDDLVDGTDIPPYHIEEVDFEL